MMVSTIMPKPVANSTLSIDWDIPYAPPGQYSRQVKMRKSFDIV